MAAMTIDPSTRPVASLPGPPSTTAGAGGIPPVGLQAHQRRLLRLFRLSVLKQRKWAEISRLLGETSGLRCLDIGSDNGVISYLLRQRGGRWTSADLDAQTVEAIRAMVGLRVVQLDGGRSPFQDGEFDRVVLVDCLEHLQDDRGFLIEIARITKPDGEVIINVPHRKQSWLRRFRLAIGQTDEAHGHVRHGYTVDELAALLGKQCTLISHHTYSRFFSEAIDTMMTWGIRWLKRESHDGGVGVKGTVVTGADVAKHEKLLFLYALLYPFVWCAAQLDRLLWFRSGYMLIARVRRCGACEAVP